MTKNFMRIIPRTEFRIAEMRLITSKNKKEVICTDNFRIAEKRLGTKKYEKEVHFPFTSSIYVYRRWEWLIVASFAYLVV